MQDGVPEDQADLLADHAEADLENGIGDEAEFGQRGGFEDRWNGEQDRRRTTPAALVGQTRGQVKSASKADKGKDKSRTVSFAEPGECAARVPVQLMVVMVRRLCLDMEISSRFGARVILSSAHVGHACIGVLCHRFWGYSWTARAASRGPDCQDCY